MSKIRLTGDIRSKIQANKPDWMALCEELVGSLPNGHPHLVQWFDVLSKRAMATGDMSVFCGAWYQQRGTPAFVYIVSSYPVFYDTRKGRREWLGLTWSDGMQCELLEPPTPIWDAYHYSRRDGCPMTKARRQVFLDNSYRYGITRKPDGE